MTSVLAGQMDDSLPDLRPAVGDGVTGVEVFQADAHKLLGASGFGSDSASVDAGVLLGRTASISP